MPKNRTGESIWRDETERNGLRTIKNAHRKGQFEALDGQTWPNMHIRN